MRNAFLQALLLLLPVLLFAPLAAAEPMLAKSAPRPVKAAGQETSPGLGRGDDVAAFNPATADWAQVVADSPYIFVGREVLQTYTDNLDDGTLGEGMANHPRLPDFLTLHSRKTMILAIGSKAREQALITLSAIPQRVLKLDASETQRINMNTSLTVVRNHAGSALVHERISQDSIYVFRRLTVTYGDLKLTPPPGAGPDLIVQKTGTFVAVPLSYLPLVEAALKQDALNR